MSKCPSCGYEVQMSHDKWEDMYRCPRPECWVFFHPEDIGLVTDRSAPIFHIGEAKA